jgi:hypothetical protein
MTSTRKGDPAMNAYTHDRSPVRPVRHRGLWIAAGLVCLIVAGTAGAASIAVQAVQRAEIIRVAVTEHGDDPVSFDVALPGAVLAAGLMLAPRVMPEEARLEIREQLGEWGPMVSTLADDLARQPDFTLVEVDDGRDHVEVHKRGRHLVVSVSSDDADVDVQVPLSLAGRATRAFES